MMSFSKSLLQPFIMEREADEFLQTNFCPWCHPAEAAWAAVTAAPHPAPAPCAALHCQ